MKKKGLTLLVAVAMLACAAIGGTLAWLTDKTGEVTNVFTTANIGVTLTETKKPDGTDKTSSDTGNWTAQMVPGYVYTKNPVVTVAANSVDCYLFVKFEETNNTFGTDNAKIIQFTNNLTAKNSGWTVLEGETGVYYREVKTDDETRTWHLIADDKVTINKELTKEVMNVENYAAPQLKYTAYAHQLWKTNVGNTDAEKKFTAAEAWKNVSKQDFSTTGGQITTGSETGGGTENGGIGA